MASLTVAGVARPWTFLGRLADGWRGAEACSGHQWRRLWRGSGAMGL